MISTTRGSAATTGTVRLHDLDWLRVVAVLAVFVFHAAHPFDLFDWHVKNDQLSLAVTLVLGPFVPFFVTGYVVFSDQRLTAAVRRDLPIALAVGVVGLAALVAADFPEWLERWSAAPSYSRDYLLMEGLYGVYAWSWTVVALGVGGRVKRFQTPLPPAVGGLALPFYVLHQPVILVIAFVVVQGSAGIPVKLALVLVGSLVATAALCGPVGRIRVLRSLLGARPPGDGR